jgi:hypothetical protein
MTGYRRRRGALPSACRFDVLIEAKEISRVVLPLDPGQPIIIAAVALPHTVLALFDDPGDETGEVGGGCFCVVKIAESRQD